MQSHLVELRPLTERENGFLEALLFEITSIGFLENPKTITRGELTTEEVTTLYAGIKKILQEEKIPEDKHDIFIQTVIKNRNAIIDISNKLANENIDAGQTAFLKLLDQSHAEIGYQKDDPVYLHLNDRLLDLPLMKELTKYNIEKSLEFIVKQAKKEKENISNPSVTTNGIFQNRTISQQTNQNDVIENKFTLN